MTNEMHELINLLADVQLKMNRINDLVDKLNSLESAREVHRETLRIMIGHKNKGE